LHERPLFARDRVTPEEALKRAEPKDHVLSGQRLTHLLDGLVAIRTEVRYARWDLPA
jgi:hypothetical protein